MIPDLVVHIDPAATGPGTLARALPLAFTVAAALEAEHAEHADALAALHAVEVAGTAARATVRAEHAAHAAAWRRGVSGPVAVSLCARGAGASGAVLSRGAVGMTAALPICGRGRRKRPRCMSSPRAIRRSSRTSCTTMGCTSRITSSDRGAW